MSVMQIVPRLPPPIDGVGDYALELAAGLRHLGIESCFAAPGEHRALLARCGKEFAASPIDVGQPASLAEAVRAAGVSAVILHFSGYGYDRRGAPLWLVKALRHLEDELGHVALLIVFHELYSTGPVSSSSFWIWPLKRHVVRRLSIMADGYITTTTAYFHTLRQWRPDIAVAHMLPVFSNVGELEAPTRVADRAPIAVLFGQEAARRRALAAASRHGGSLRRLGIKEVLEIGPGHTGCERDLGSIPLRTAGPFGAEEVHAVLGRVRFGLVSYPLALATKSSIIAAYLAHGVICVNVAAVGEPSAELTANEHLVVPGVRGEEIQTDLDALEDIARRGHAWYMDHSVARAADYCAEAIRRLTTS